MRVGPTMPRREMSRPGISKALETIEVSPRPNDGVLAADAHRDGVLVGGHLAEELQQHHLLFDGLDDAEDRAGEVLLGAHEVRGAGDDEPVLRCTRACSASVAASVCSTAAWRRIGRVDLAGEQRRRHRAMVDRPRPVRSVARAARRASRRRRAARARRVAARPARSRRSGCRARGRARARRARRGARARCRSSGTARPRAGW